MVSQSDDLLFLASPGNLRRGNSLRSSPTSGYIGGKNKVFTIRFVFELNFQPVIERLVNVSILKNYVENSCTQLANGVLGEKAKNISVNFFKILSSYFSKKI